MIGIYKIINPKNRVYIGQSINIEKRLNYYKWSKAKGQIRLNRSFVKYGVDNHKFEIICECEISELNDKERYYQDLYNVLENGLNCLLTKSNNKSGKASKETRLKMRLHKESLSFLELSKRMDSIKKIVLDTNTGIFYLGVQEAAFSHNLNKGTLTSRLSGLLINNTNFIYV